MKLILTDQATGLILSLDEDIRILSTLKGIILDTNLVHLFPSRHKTFYEAINHEFIANYHAGIRSENLYFIEDISEDLVLKKTLSVNKYYFIKMMYNCATLLINQSTFFIDSNIFSMFKDIENDLDLLEEYASIRNLSKEQCLKEIKIKVKNTMINSIKVQAGIDKFTEELTYVNNLDDLKKIKENMLMYFVRTL